MMGEDPAEVWSKAAMDPNPLSESDIARAQFMINFWWKDHNRMAYLVEEGLGDDNWRDALGYHTAHTYGGDKVAASIWSYWTRLYPFWERLNIFRTPTCSEMLRVFES